jgi:ABC-type glycerol-3-phosphate transport system substrate-binding protein
VHTVGIYYNKDLLNKYSLSVPTNRQELIQAAKTVQTGEKVTNSQFLGSTFIFSLAIRMDFYSIFISK